MNIKKKISIETLMERKPALEKLIRILDLENQESTVPSISNLPRDNQAVED